VTEETKGKHKTNKRTQIQPIARTVFAGNRCVSQKSTDMHRSGIKIINEGESLAMHSTDDIDQISLSPTDCLEASCLNKIKEKEKQTNINHHSTERVRGR
jgi:hypothetical protein